MTTGAGSQLSVALAIPVLSGDVESVHSIVTSAGHSVMTGGVVSCTVIVCRHVLEFPHESVAVHVLAMDNSCGHPPGVMTSL